MKFNIIMLKDLIYANQAKSDIFHQSSEFQKVLNILKAGFQQGDGFHQGIDLHQCENCINIMNFINVKVYVE